MYFVLWCLLNKTIPWTFVHVQKFWSIVNGSVTFTHTCTCISKSKHSNNCMWYTNTFCQLVRMRLVSNRNILNDLLMFAELNTSIRQTEWLHFLETNLFTNWIPVTPQIIGWCRILRNCLNLTSGDLESPRQGGGTNPQRIFWPNFPPKNCMKMKEIGSKGAHIFGVPLDRRMLMVSVGTFRFRLTCWTYWCSCKAVICSEQNSKMLFPAHSRYTRLPSHF